MTLDGRVRGLETLETPRFSGAQVYHSVNQSVSNATNTVVAFDSEAFDTDDYHDPVTNNSRLTVPIDGYYLLVASVHFATNSTGFRALYFRVNGNAISQNVAHASVSGPVALNLSKIALLAAGDYVDCLVYQNSGGALDLTKITDRSPYFEIALLG